VSYFNDSEQNWDDRPFFLEVERQLGRSGSHIHVASQEYFGFELEGRGFIATPAQLARHSEAAKEFLLCATSNGNRVLLSGVGGDEATGGVPTPLPELQNLLARA